MANYYNKDLYKTLNVTFEATLDDIKTSYRKLARIYHPDVAGSEEAAEKFKEIREAYDILSNEKARRKYDVLHGYFREKQQKVMEEKEKIKRREEYFKKAKERAPKSESFANSLNDAIDSLFHAGKTSTKPQPKKQEKQKEASAQTNGDDINTEVNITCFEAINGTNRKINILHTQPCPNCNGHKFINGSICPMCKGSGIQSTQKKINVKIPKGVSQGTKVRIKGEGNPGLNGGKNGDLFLVVNIEKNPYFEIDGNNILCNLPVSPAEAVFGADITIPVFNNKITVKIPPMTSSGQKLKITGEGLPNKNNTRKGDIIITVQIKLPKKLSKEETQIYEELSKWSNEDVRKDMKNEQ